MNIAILTSRYVSPEAPYSHTFVHTRSKAYVSAGHRVQVFVPARKSHVYEVDGIQVTLSSGKQISQRLNGFDACCVHLLHPDIHPRENANPIYHAIIKSRKQAILFFLHGIDTLRISKIAPFDRFTSAEHFARFINRDYYVLPRLKAHIKTLLTEKPDCQFIFPSRWLRRQSESEIGITYGDRASIIPNGIDLQRFSFSDRWPDRARILVLKPQVLRGNYAMDTTLSVLKMAPEKLSFSIYGKGGDQEKIRRMLESRRSIRIVNSFVNHEELKRIHNSHGIFFNLTRMDTQGVSMGEAMASGLAVVTNNVCAIPEFIANRENGISLEPDHPEKVLENILALVEDRELYSRVTQNARSRIEQLDINKTTRRELELITERLGTG